MYVYLLSKSGLPVDLTGMPSVPSTWLHCRLSTLSLVTFCTVKSLIIIIIIIIISEIFTHYLCSLFYFIINFFLVGLIAALWSDNSSVRKWVISKPCEVFRKKYDDVQDLLQRLSYG